MAVAEAAFKLKLASGTAVMGSIIATVAVVINVVLFGKCKLAACAAKVVPVAV